MHDLGLVADLLNILRDRQHLDVLEHDFRQRTVVAGYRYQDVNVSMRQDEARDVAHFIYWHRKRAHPGRDQQRQHSGILVAGEQPVGNDRLVLDEAGLGVFPDYSGGIGERTGRQRVARPAHGLDRILVDLAADTEFARRDDDVHRLQPGRLDLGFAFLQRRIHHHRHYQRQEQSQRNENKWPSHLPSPARTAAHSPGQRSSDRAYEALAAPGSVGRDGKLITTRPGLFGILSTPKKSNVPESATERLLLTAPIKVRSAAPASHTSPLPRAFKVRRAAAAAAPNPLPEPDGGVEVNFAGLS